MSILLHLTSIKTIIQRAIKQFHLIEEKKVRPISQAAAFCLQIFFPCLAIHYSCTHRLLSFSLYTILHLMHFLSALVPDKHKHSLVYKCIHGFYSCAQQARHRIPHKQTTHAYYTKQTHWVEIVAHMCAFLHFISFGQNGGFFQI